MRDHLCWLILNFAGGVVYLSGPFEALDLPFWSFKCPGWFLQVTKISYDLVNHQWPFQEPIDWRYLPYIRPIFQAYVREYPHKTWDDHLWIGWRENLQETIWFLPSNWSGFPVFFFIIQFYDWFKTRIFHQGWWFDMIWPAISVTIHWIPIKIRGLCRPILPPDPRDLQAMALPSARPSIGQCCSRCRSDSSRWRMRIKRNCRTGIVNLWNLWIIMVNNG